MADKSSKSAPASSDDRNLINTGATDINELEDQLALWWDKYKTQVVIVVGAVLVAFVGYHVIRFTSDSARASQAESFQEADDKLAWAEENASSALAGFAFKEEADKAYEDGDYAKAASLYEKSAASAKLSIKSAALMGQAISLLQQSKTSEAKPILQSLADDENSGNSVEAKYRLAEIAAAEQDYENARELVEGLMEGAGNQAAFYWIQKGFMLQSNFPPAPEEDEETSE
ncbi:MAG: hypothetical protein AAGB46_03775 [Verrucomicrobiota bacterium]